MNKQGFLKAHSKKKLQIYKEYLSSYLNVLSFSPFKNIEIIDLFAGKGQTEDGGEGSAIIAAKEIKKFIYNAKFSEKKYRFILNELDFKNLTTLKENLKNYDFIEYSNVTANEYLQNYKQNINTHTFFFADQFGYTDVDFNILSKRLQQYNCEFLVFMTISYIFRFIRSDYNKTKKHTKTIDLFDNECEPVPSVSEHIHEKQNPSLGFLNELGIGEEIAKMYKNSNELANAITKAIKIKSNQNLVNCRKFRTEDRNNLYCLYYITKNRMGMKKFIEAFSRVERTSLEIPLDLPIDLEPEIIEFIVKHGGQVTNIQMSDFALSAGIPSKEVRTCLANMEKKRLIEVANVGNEVRERKGFYIDYFSRLKAKINIIIKEKNGTVND